MNKFFYNNYEVISIHNPRLKNSYICIEDNNKIIIKSSNKSKSYILNLLESREAWIKKQFQKQKSFICLEMKLEDEILLFGETYSIDHENALILREKIDKLRIYSKEKVLRCYDDFYKVLAKKYIKERVEYFAKMMDLSFSTIKYRKMKTRWGSCSSKKVLTFNTELMKIDKEMIDYVVVHELAHLKHMNHSKAFHNFVQEYFPNSKQSRTKLKQVRLR